MNKPIPYQDKTEPIIHDIGKLAEELWVFVAELGDSLEIECESCVVTISKRIGGIG